MFQRFKDATAYSNVSDFNTTPGVSFCIHVYYVDGTTKKTMALAPPLNKTSLLNVSSNNHPDQLYLALSSVTTKLATLRGKTIERVEVDDTITFCGTGTGQCGKVIPDWVRTNFPSIPALLFIHKSDTAHTPGGKHYYDLYDSSINDTWSWVDIAPVVVAVPAVRYVAVYICKNAMCVNRNKVMMLIEVAHATGNGRGALAFVPVASATCACGRAYEHKHTRVMLPADNPLVTIS